MTRKSTIHLVAAARPNFMKVAPLYHALRSTEWAVPVIVHTGQHYDANMSAAFFEDLRLPPPAVNLEVGSGSHAEQTAGVMVAYERLCIERRPDWVVVVGDVNSTMACTLVAKKIDLPVAHLEAGLRSFDRTMPEEINRLVTDAICDLLWTPSEDADRNLRNEGVAADKIVRVGNIMIDSYELVRPRVETAPGPATLGLEPGRYGIVTLHRPANVDAADTLAMLVDVLCRAADRVALVFPVHPRTRSRLEKFQLLDRLAAHPAIRLCEPLGYIGFMALVSRARLAITDSGGLQEETTYLGIPCLTVRDTTERPITVSHGTNRLVAAAHLLATIGEVVDGHWPAGRRPPLWDGRTAQRVAASLRQAAAHGPG